MKRIHLCLGLLALAALSSPADSRTGSTPRSRASERLVLKGNLPAVISGPLNQTLFTAAAFLIDGDQSPAKWDTPLNDLLNNTTPYVSGDQIHIGGTFKDGRAIGARFIYGNGAGQHGTTLGDLVFRIGQALQRSGHIKNGAVARLNSGMIELTDKFPGPSLLSLHIADGPSNAGQTAWNAHTFLVVVSGTAPQSVSAVGQICDPLGNFHQLEFQFIRNSTPLASTFEWSLIPILDPSEGLLISGPMTVEFNSDGTLRMAHGVLSLSISWAYAQPVTQQIRLEFVTPDQLDGLTQFGTQTTVQIEDPEGNC